MTAVRAPIPTHRDPMRLDIERHSGVYTSLGYRSAKVAAREGRPYSEGSGDVHADFSRVDLINQSRAFQRDNPIYSGMINRSVSYIMGNGFTLQVVDEDKDRAKRIESAWRQAERRPESRQLFSGSKCARMFCRESLICGDTGAIKREDGLIQLVEAEQITSGNKMNSGITVDADGRPTVFKVCPWGAGGRVVASKPTSVEAKDFLFLTHSERSSQTRGVPVLQSSFANLHRINDVCDSEAVAWQMISRIVLTITREEAAKKAYTESAVDTGKCSSAESEGDFATRITELDYGLLFHGKPGEKIEGVTRNIPGSNFSDSLRMFLRLLGLPLGLPLELILLDWTNGNYSQSRAVLEQAYQGFIEIQQLMEDCYYTPLADWRIELWRKELKLGSGPVQFAWIKPTFPWIDQLKEAEAQAKKLDRCLVSHGSVCKSLNADRDDVVNARDGEVRDAINRAAAIEKETQVKVPWQIFAGLDIPGAARPSPDLPDSDDTNPPPGGTQKEQS